MKEIAEKVVKSDGSDFEERRKLMQMELLYDVAIDLNSSLDSDVLHGDILTKALMMSDASAAALLEMDEELRFRTVEVLSPEPFPEDVFSRDELLNAWNDRHLVEFTREGVGWNHICVIPLISREKPNGLLIVSDKEQRDGTKTRFTEHDIHLLQSFAYLAGASFQNAKLHTQLQDTLSKLDKSSFENRRKLLQMEMLYDIGLELSGSLDPMMVVDDILNRAIAMVDARGAALIDYKGGKDVFSTTACVSVEEVPADLLSRPVLKEAWDSGRNQAISLSTSSWSELYVVPLVFQNDVSGLLVVADKENIDGSVSPFSDDDESLLQSFAHLAGSALRNANLYKDLQATYEALKETQDQKDFVEGAFGVYLSPNVVDHIMANPDSISRLGGEERVLTAFFSDIAGFTTISECLEPNELVELVNFYLTEMCEIIEERGGTIDKFEGDAIVSFFGAPIYFKDHAEKAVLSALDQQQKLRELRLEWAKPGVLPRELESLHRKWTQQGTPFMHVRMGVATGPMVVGNMGSKTRSDYTMMGDTVNLAARFESCQKQYGTSILVNEETWNTVKNEVVTRLLDRVQVVGKQEAVGAYEIVARKTEISEDALQCVSRFNEGQKYYEDFEFAKALKFFESSVELDPADVPSRIYVERCVRYMQAPPDDLVHRLDSK